MRGGEKEGCGQMIGLGEREREGDWEGYCDGSV